MIPRSKYRVIKQQVPMGWEMRLDANGQWQPMPTAFVPVYVVQVEGTLWWHDVKYFDNIRDAAQFRNLLNQKHHGEI